MLARRDKIFLPFFHTKREEFFNSVNTHTHTKHRQQEHTKLCTDFCLSLCCECERKSSVHWRPASHMLAAAAREPTFFPMLDAAAAASGRQSSSWCVDKKKKKELSGCCCCCCCVVVWILRQHEVGGCQVCSLLELIIIRSRVRAHQSSRSIDRLIDEQQQRGLSFTGAAASHWLSAMMSEESEWSEWSEM